MFQGAANTHASLAMSIQVTQEPIRHPPARDTYLISAVVAFLMRSFFVLHTHTECAFQSMWFDNLRLIGLNTLIGRACGTVDMLSTNQLEEAQHSSEHLRTQGCPTGGRFAFDQVAQSISHDCLPSDVGSPFFRGT